MSQPHDGDTKTADTTATATPRDVTATSRRPCPGTPRHPEHDGHATARPQPRHGHDGHDGHGHDRIRGTCPRNTTRHAKTQSHKRSNVAPCNKHPRGGASPGHKKQGRWLSSADAECSLEHFWITCYSRSLHIFSGCNRCCTLHIVYNVPWIDVDGGEASLSHINVWPSTHKGSVKILDAVRSAVRLVYLGRGLYGLVPIILGWSAIMLAQPFGCRVRFPRFALGFMGVAACEIDGIARISPLEHVGDKRLPALIRWLMTEGEARPNGCIYTYTFLAVGGKSQSTIPLSCQLGQ